MNNEPFANYIVDKVLRCHVRNWQNFGGVFGGHSDSAYGVNLIKLLHQESSDRSNFNCISNAG